MNIQQHDTELFQLYKNHKSTTYPSFLEKFGLNATAEKANGAIIIDSNGKEYIDCVSGYGILNIGHNHPKIIQDIIDLLQKNLLCTNPLFSDIQIQAASKLAEIAPENLQYSYLCNSGSEAIDNAIKLARLHTGKKEIITAINSYHGYTYGGLSATGIDSFTKYFKPLIPSMMQVPYGDIKSIEHAITSDTAAILLEPMQHEAGIHIPPDNYLKQVRKLCDDHNILLILDEIKTGMGKTGTMFYCEALRVVPDILVIGKSLGGGIVPIGAILSSKKLWRKFSYCFSMAASSYAGNILACQAVISTIDILKEEELISSCKTKNTYLQQELNKLIETYTNLFKSMSGKGLLYGLKTHDAQTALAITKNLIQEEILVLPSYGDPETIMIEPPLVISDEQIKKIIKALHNVCKKME